MHRAFHPAISRALKPATKALAASLLLLAAATLPMHAPAQGAAETAALAVDAPWMALIDAEKYDEAWKTAAPQLRKSAPELQFARQVQAARAPMGALVARNLRQSQATDHLPGVPDGHYVVVQYNTRFEHKQDALETIIATQAEDGTWRVCGYFIR